MELKKPYLLFLGDAADQLAAKVAQGIQTWRPEYCVGQYRLDGCNADVGLEDISIKEAAEAGCKTLIIGVANRGGVISEKWLSVLIEAIESGMDIASGLHNKLSDIPELVECAEKNGCSLFDVRYPTHEYPVANGIKRSGKRLLTVGTDCSVGKMYTSLAIEKEMQAHGFDVDFRATGQTGILITGGGVSVDCVVADFIAGAIETIAPENESKHWDVIEGQGSLFHASFAGVTMGLIHGAQPDVLVLCHEPTREHMRGLPGYSLPDLKSCIDTNLSAARLTNPDAKCIGISVNTSNMAVQEAMTYMDHLETEIGLPVVDPFRQGVSRLVEQLKELS
ncbi:EBNA-1 nuclear protein [Photobacterium gaetbulicola]|uniref:EBNA-1 nuclear protein n=1 Tax=Photobacterium gaetbulicola TaxID=1295392 RepID=A0A0B9G2E9_9GAMM|nr:N-acetyltransferase DgcN [Photobacterium gaetbulicola]KHT62948.1 EBNA-1 nuclear protein [Photobacterium gaetbulicola]